MKKLLIIMSLSLVILACDKRDDPKPMAKQAAVTPTDTVVIFKLNSASDYPQAYCKAELRDSLQRVVKSWKSPTFYLHAGSPVVYVVKMNAIPNIGKCQWRLSAFDYTRGTMGGYNTTIQNETFTTDSIYAVPVLPWANIAFDLN